MAGQILGGRIVVAVIVLNACIWTSHSQTTIPPTCTVNGRIPAVAGTCSNQYYLCYNPNPNGNGNFSQWLYTCPGSSVFNEVSGRCSTACPTPTTTAAPVTTAPTTTAGPVTTAPTTTAGPVTTAPTTTAGPVSTAATTAAIPISTAPTNTAAPVTTPASVGP